MQSIGTYLRRKSIQKIQPQMPRRKISQNSRDDKRRKHRTQYKGIETPQVQLKNYKRKNLNIIDELEKQTNNYLKETVPTDRTEQSKLCAEQLIGSNARRNRGNYTVDSFNNDPLSTNQKSGALRNRQQMTSRFAQNHHDAESLTLLINLAKQSDKNPLINTARLKQQQNSQNELHRESDQKQTSLFSSGNQIGQKSNINMLGKAEQKDRDTTGTIKQSDYNRNYQDQNEQLQLKSGQNFDDYQFGGQNQLNGQFFEGRTFASEVSEKSKKWLSSPKVRSYISDNLTNQKPQNWRQLNRYIPQTEQQHRMGLQHYNKLKESIQSKRQNQQIMKTIQQYQINKNMINATSKRKAQTQRIMHKIHHDKKLPDQKKHSLSLPQLKKVTEPKKQIIIPGLNQINLDFHKNLNNIQERFRIKSRISKDCEVQGRKQRTKQLRNSLSYGKMGFGSRRPRILNQEQMNQSQLNNIQKIQRKLREKGVQFNPSSIRKGLLSFRHIPIYKITQDKQANSQVPILVETELQLPQKQLPSNAFYRIFPL